MLTEVSEVRHDAVSSPRLDCRTAPVATGGAADDGSGSESEEEGGGEEGDVSASGTDEREAENGEGEEPVTGPRTRPASIRHA